MPAGRTACFVGRGALAVACATEWLHQGHHVTCLVSDDAQVTDWARANGLPCHSNLAAERERPDFLFSVAHRAVLAAAELAVPSVMAVNCHTSPLPRYAGVYQTSWAVLNGETEYGVTWHEMTPRIDGGAILEQRMFRVAPDETTLTLSMKCFNHGVAAFTALIPRLTQGDLRAVPQDSAYRTYYSLADRMPRAGLLSWTQSADEMVRWTLAADVGPYDNEFGAPKIVAGEIPAVVGEAAAVENVRPTAPAGTLLRLDGTGLVVATVDGAVRFSRLALLTGESIEPARLLDLAGLVVGDSLERWDDATLTAVDSAARRVARHERFWIDLLAQVQEVELPGVGAERPEDDAVCVVRLPGHFQGLSTPEAAQLLVEGWQQHLASLGQPSRTIWWSHSEAAPGLGAAQRLFSPVVPLVDGMFPRDVTDRTTYLRDVWQRYRQLLPRRAGLVIAVDEEPDDVAADAVVVLDPAAWQVRIRSTDSESAFHAAHSARLALTNRVG